MDVAGNML